MGHHACKRTDRTPDPEPLTGGPHGTPSVQKDRKEPCRGHPITTRPNQRHPTDHHPSEPKTTRSPPVQAPRPTHATRAWGGRPVGSELRLPDGIESWIPRMSLMSAPGHLKPGGRAYTIIPCDAGAPAPPKRPGPLHALAPKAPRPPPTSPGPWTGHDAPY